MENFRLVDMRLPIAVEITDIFGENVTVIVERHEYLSLIELLRDNPKVKNYQENSVDMIG